MKKANVENFEYQIFFAASPDSAVFLHRPKFLSKGVYSNRSTSYLKFDASVDMDFSKSDTAKLYYCFISKYVVMERGCVVVDKEQLKNGVKLDPIEHCQKVVLKNALGVEGNPVKTHYIFYPFKRPDLRSVNLYDWERASITLDAVSENADGGSSAFWTEAGRDLPYVVAAKGPYLMKNDRYMMSAAETPDTLALDFREAKKVAFGVNDVDGKVMDLRELKLEGQGYGVCTFQTKLATGHRLMEDGEVTLVYVMTFDNINLEAPVDHLDIYGFPGDYIFSFWGFPKTEKYKFAFPRGLEGLLTVKDEEEAQRVVFDYSNYLTVKLNSNIDVPSFHAQDYWFRNPSRSPEQNRLLDAFCFDSGRHFMSDAYSKLDKDEDGNAIVRIWPAVGFETADIAGKIADAEGAVEKIDLNVVKEVTMEIPDLYKVKFVYPKLLSYFNSNVCTEDGIFDLGRHEGHDFSSEPEIFVQTDTIETYRKMGDHEVFFQLKDKENDHSYVSDVHRYQVADAEETVIDLPWNRAVIFEEQLPDFVTDMDTKLVGDAGFELARMVSADDSGYVEKLCLFDEEGLHDYAVLAPQYIEQRGRVNVGQELTREQVVLVEEDLLTIKNVGSKGAVHFSPQSFVYENGNYLDFKTKSRTDSLSMFVLPGHFVCEGFYRNRNVRECVPVYVFNINTKEELNVEVANWCSTISFVDGEDLLPLACVEENHEVDENRVNLYVMGSPYFRAEEPITVHGAFKNENRHRVSLFAGLYCAEDHLGNRVYFEVPADRKEDMTIDFANPPVPPTGIETAEGESCSPVAYYDLSGRQIAAPRRGINLLRLANGRVIKRFLK